MPTIRIYDIEAQALAVHLRDLLDGLGPQSLRARWTIAPVASNDPSHSSFEATGPCGAK